jgi:hypothetical protein
VENIKEINKKLEKIFELYCKKIFKYKDYVMFQKYLAINWHEELKIWNSSMNLNSFDFAMNLLENYRKILVICKKEQDKKLESDLMD